MIPVGPGAAQRREAPRRTAWPSGCSTTASCCTARRGLRHVGPTIAAGSYVVFPDQPLRGIAFTALAAGVDYSLRINQLYAPPGAWSHGLMWGADTAEVPRGDATSHPRPRSSPRSTRTAASRRGPSDWYSITTRGVREQKAILALLRDGVYGEIAEQAFVSAPAGRRPRAR